MPDDFGLIGMVLIFSGFARLFAEFGFGSALVQRSVITDLHTSSIFWINLLVGGVLAGVFFLLAPEIAAFYDAPQLRVIGQAVAATFVIAAFGTVPRAILQRNMAFDRLARIEVSASVISGSVALLLAILGYGVWSLVVQSVTAAAVTSALALALANFRPRRVYSRAAVRELLGFSANLFAFNFVNYWSRNADNLLVAKMIGASGLGIYARAYSFMLLPITQVLAVIGRVVFPALASVQKDTARARRMYLRVLRIVTVVTAPMMAGMLVVAEVLVIALLGDKWLAVVPVLQILCIVGILQTLTNPVGWIYQSQGRTDLLFRWGVGSSVVIVTAVFVGASMGSVEAVAWAYLIANVVLFYPCIAIPARLIGMATKDVGGAVGGILACAVLMAIIVWASGLVLPTGWSSGLTLAVQTGLGAVCYCVLVALLCRSTFVEVLTLIQEQQHHYRQRPLTASAP